MNNGAEDREAFAAFLLRLRAKGIGSKDVLTSFEATPRRAFIPPRWHDVVWSDRMIPIECGEAIEGADLQALVVTGDGAAPGQPVADHHRSSACQRPPRTCWITSTNSWTWRACTPWSCGSNARVGSPIMDPLV